MYVVKSKRENWYCVWCLPSSRTFKDVKTFLKIFPISDVITKNVSKIQLTSVTMTKLEYSEVSRRLHFKLGDLGLLLDHILRVTQLGHSQEYSRITWPYTHIFLVNSSGSGVLRYNSSFASVNGVIDSLLSYCYCFRSLESHDLLLLVTVNDCFRHMAYKGCMTWN